MELFHSKDAVLSIDVDALQKMIECVLHHQTLEAGGILLGKKSSAGDTYSIVDVGLPSKFDKQGPVSFVRSKISAKRLVNKAWHQSCGVINHIGEWHSHTFNSPWPSMQDQCDMMRAYTDGEFVFNYFFTVIVSKDLQIFTGLVSHGNIIDHNIVKIGGQVCTGTAQIRKANGEEKL